MKTQPSEQDIEAVQRELVAHFTRYDNWKNRYRLLIEMGKQLNMPEAWRTEENRIHGCQSQVWLHAEEKDGRLYFHGISDAAIVSGLVAMLLQVYSGRTPEEILKAPLDFLKEMGLLQHLSPNRANGLYHMIKRIQKIAKDALIRKIKAQQSGQNAS